MGPDFESYSVHSSFSISKDKSTPIKNELPTLSKLYSIYEEIPEDLLDEADIDAYFYRRILNITKIENRLVRLSKTSNENSSQLKVCKIDCSTIQQKYTLGEENTLTRRELGVVLHCLTISYNHSMQLDYRNITSYQHRKLPLATRF